MVEELGGIEVEDKEVAGREEEGADIRGGGRVRENNFGEKENMDEIG